MVSSDGDEVSVYIDRPSDAELERGWSDRPHIGGTCDRANFHGALMDPGRALALLTRRSRPAKSVSWGDRAGFSTNIGLVSVSLNSCG
jgi:hypothetical protein